MKTRTAVPLEPVSYTESQIYLRGAERSFENPAFTRTWRIFIGMTISLILIILFGIAYLATEITSKHYRLMQLEESIKNLESEISHAEAGNLAVRRDVFFDEGLKSRLNLVYPEVTRFVPFIRIESGAGGEELVRSLYGFGKSAVRWKGSLIKF